MSWNHVQTHIWCRYAKLIKNIFLGFQIWGLKKTLKPEEKLRVQHQPNLKHKWKEQKYQYYIWSYCLVWLLSLVSLPENSYNTNIKLVMLLKSSRNKKDLNDITAAPFSVSFSQLQAAKKHQKRGSCDVIKVLLISWQLYQPLKKYS